MICEEAGCTADLALLMPCCRWYLCAVHAAVHDEQPAMYHPDRRSGTRRRAYRTGGRRAADRAEV
jgi:hypothetical protein